MRALVTGAAGFVGRHLVRQLRESGDDVCALVPPSDSREGLFPPDIVAPDDVVICDLLEDERVTQSIARAAPDAIYHLAGYSNPEGSLSSARRTLETNIFGAQNLLEASLKSGRAPRVLLIGSAQQYGHVAEDDQPIREDAAQKPLTPYAVSKATQELLGQRYFVAEDLPVLWTRSFNHTGPGQAATYVCSSFAKQVVDVEKGKAVPEIHVGNLAAQRDFTDVRDVAAAYAALVGKGTAGVAYNVGSGEAVAIEEVLATLVSLSEVDIEVRVDPERYHRVDAPLIVGDVTRLQQDTGWARRLSLRQTLQDLLDDWRRRA